MTHSFPTRRPSYLPLEPLLASRDGALMARIETAMGAVRAAIQKGAPVAEVRHEISALDTLFTDAEQVLAPEQASRSEEHTSELQSLMRISYAVFCLKKKKESKKKHKKSLKK